MADVYSAIILDDDYWDGTISWAGETSEANRDTKYSTRRYTSPDAWETARDGVAQAADHEHGVIIGAWASVYTGIFTILGWEDTVIITLECPLTLPDGVNPARHDGIFGNVSNSFIWEVSASAAILTISESNVTIDGLQFHNTVVADNVSYCILITSAVTGIVIKNNIMSTADTGGNGVTFTNASITGEIFNNIIFCPHTQGTLSEAILITNSTTVDIYCNTIKNYAQGIERDAASVDAVNNVVFDNATDFDGTFNVIDHNASDDGTGTNAIAPSGADWNNELTDPSNNVLTPISGGNIETGGIGPSLDAKVPVLDMLGNTRSGTTCTVGAIEFQAVGGISIPVIMNTLRQMAS